MSILVVDDAAFSSSIISNYLTGAGFAVLQAGHGGEALGILDDPDKSSDVQLIVSDLLMPTIDGKELLRELGRRQSPIPVVVLTADIQATTRQECIELGCAGFVNKPVLAEPLVETVQAILSKAQAS